MPRTRKKPEPAIDAATSRRYLLHEPADHARFEGLATRLGFTPRERLGSLGVDLSDIWHHSELGQQLQWLEWPAVGARFVAVWGRDWMRLASRVERGLRVVTPEDLCLSLWQALRLRRAELAVDEIVRTVKWVGFVSVWESALVIECADTLAADNDPAVRRELATAWAIHRWPTCRKRIERLAALDPDDGVREHASRMLAAFPST